MYYTVRVLPESRIPSNLLLYHYNIVVPSCREGGGGEILVFVFRSECIAAQFGSEFSIAINLENGRAAVPTCQNSQSVLCVALTNAWPLVIACPRVVMWSLVIADTLTY